MSPQYTDNTASVLSGVVRRIRLSTPLDLHTRRTDNGDRILQALTFC
jgi:hypothetical protein